MTSQTAENPFRSIRVPTRRDELVKSYLQLHADVAALWEDNRQLRAALRIFSEVARNSPDTLPLHRTAAA